MADREYLAIESSVCCSCSKTATLKKSFPCGHKICHYPCLANLRSGKSSNDVMVCPNCSNVDDRTSTMPRRLPPEPPNCDNMERIELARRLLEGSDVGETRKISVRIFCKHSSNASNQSSCDKSCDTGATPKQEESGFQIGHHTDLEKKLSDRLKDLKEAEKKLPDAIDKSQTDYRKKLNTLGEKVRDAAVEVKLKVDEEESNLLHLLGEAASERSKHCIHMYEAYDELLEKEHQVEDRLMKAVAMRGETKHQALRDIETSINELNSKARSIESQCKEKMFNLSFSCCTNKDGTLLGKIIEKKLNPRSSSERLHKPPERSLKLPNLDKKPHIILSSFCVGIVWLEENKFAAVFDRLKTDEKAIEIQIYTLSANGSVDKSGQPFQVNKNICANQGEICVCNKVGPDKASVLLALGKEVIRVTVNLSGPNLKWLSKTSKLRKVVHGLSWATDIDKWYVLFASPWTIFLVTESVSASSKRVLGSNWYYTTLYSFQSLIAVADISKNVFKIYDMNKNDKSMSISPMIEIGKVWPASVTCDEVAGKWFLLWKTIGGNAGNQGEWFITTHSILCQDYGLVRCGILSDGDPIAIAIVNGHMAILYNGGKLFMFDVGRSNIYMHAR
ncbi:uncharacterized protein [Apostichopus japonicus]|uniref:uncharacterized protein n=1 Tax=Stichopus japonicus TaxID=307972 RepID=UPI003AB64086